MSEDIQRELGGIEAKLKNIETMMSRFVSKCENLEEEQKETSTDLSILQTQIKTATGIFIIFGPVLGGIIATITNQIWMFFSKVSN